MVNDALMTVTRNQRWMLLDAEHRARKTGAWGAWEHIRFSEGSVGSGWSYGFNMASKNAVFSVLRRTLDSGVEHMAITSLSGIRPTWHEMQRIKDELAGYQKTGIEVYPPKREIVDEADMFHLWILTEPLPFGLKVPS